MLYLYDKAIVDDLMKSFNPENVVNPVVRVIDPEGAVNVAAQIQNDDISFPVVVLNREDDVSIDNQRWNFTRAKKGVPVAFDTSTNMIYKEKSLPVHLDYKMTILTTNTVDMDEIIKEIMFKYSDMYYLTIRLPYEVSRKIRFGIQLDNSATIQRSSGSSEYLSEGKLYQSILSFKCEGCVLLSYVPVHLKRTEYQVEPK